MSDEFAWAHRAFAVVLQRDEPTWLKTLRKKQFDEALAMGLPSRDNEDWKYSSTSFLKTRDFEERHCEERFLRRGNLIFEESGSPRPSASRPRDDEPGKLDSSSLISREASRLVFVDGVFNSSLSDSKLPEGLVAMSIMEALISHEAVIKKQLESADTAFKKLNVALMQDGAFIVVQKNLAESLHCMYLTTTGGTAAYRNIILVEEGAEYYLVEEYQSATTESYFNNIVSDIYLAPRAHMHYSKIQNESQSGVHIANTSVHQDRDSAWSSHVLSVGGEWSREDLTIFLEQKGAQCSLNGVYALSGSQQCDHHTKIMHQADHTESRELYKGVVDGKATAVFNGKVIVQPGIKKIVAEQANHNLLLSKEATVNTKPELEIYADDVKCAHGATIGQLDIDKIFYCRSRGLSLEAAKALLVHAFLLEVFSESPLKNTFENLLEKQHV